MEAVQHDIGVQELDEGWKGSWVTFLPLCWSRFSEGWGSLHVARFTLRFQGSFGQPQDTSVAKDYHEVSGGFRGVYLLFCFVPRVSFGYGFSAWDI